jgi:quercetin dioxygenase-like cupin family protein
MARTDPTDAPGQGLIPSISSHTSSLPVLYDLGAQPAESVGPGLARQYLHGAGMTVSRWTMQKGTVVPVHHHLAEQATMMLEGAADVYSQGKKFVLRAGDIIIIPPNVPHEFRFTEDTMEGTANYYLK